MTAGLKFLGSVPCPFNIQGRLFFVHCQVGQAIRDWNVANDATNYRKQRLQECIVDQV